MSLLSSIFGGGSSSSNQTTNKTDYNTTAYNSSIAGQDSEVGDGSIVALHSNLSTVDNSLSNYMADNSAKDSSVRTANSNNSDSSNNSVNNAMTDNSNRSSSSSNSNNTDSSVTNTMSDYSNRSISDSRVANSHNSDSSNNSVNNSMTDSSNRSNNSDNSVHTTITSTDGGSFAMVGDIFKSVSSLISSTNKSALDLVGLNSKATLGVQSEIAGRSLDAAMAIKSGAVISEPANRSNSALIDAAVKIAAVSALGFAVVKIFGKK